MYFTKMHGCGNDYVYVDCINQTVENRSDLAVRVSDRHFGIGADGLICIDSSTVADFKMDMYNADGSRGSMCGNGIRCVGKFVYDYGLTDKECITVETLSGIKTLHLNLCDGRVDTVRVCMGEPVFDSSAIPVLSDNEKCLNQTVSIANREWVISCVSMGNPHAVVFVDDLESLDLMEIGPQFERNPMFPDRINTEFIQVMSDERIKMRVWERGSGETFACGTGACASVVIATLNNFVKNCAVVELRGGNLKVEWDQGSNLVYMTGPAEIVFEGQLK